MKSDLMIEKIADLMKRLGGSQKEFSEIVGVSQQAISNWLSMGNPNTPSPQSLMRMGELAGYPDCFWFWAEAGLNKNAMLSAAGALLKKWGELADSKSVAVAPLQAGNPDNASPEDLWHIDARQAPNPGSVVYYELGDSVKTNIRFKPAQGDYVILDTSSSPTLKLLPFWNQLALVVVTDEVLKIERRFLPPTPGEYIGWLTCGHLATRRGGVSLALLSEIENPGPLVNLAEVKGTVLGRLDHKVKDMPVSYAQENLRLFPGCAVLGRVLDWVTPPKAIIAAAKAAREDAEYKEFLAWKAAQEAKKKDGK